MAAANAMRMHANHAGPLPLRLQPCMRAAALHCPRQQASHTERGCGHLQGSSRCSGSFYSRRHQGGCTYGRGSSSRPSSLRCDATGDGAGDTSDDSAAAAASGASADSTGQDAYAEGSNSKGKERSDRGQGAGEQGAVTGQDAGEGRSSAQGGSEPRQGVPSQGQDDAGEGKGSKEAGQSGPESMRANLERLFAAADAAETEPSPSAMQQSLPHSRGGIPVRWPSVDWSRYNLQLLFLDRSGTLRSRLAAAIFESIAEWNGWSRMMVPWSCGLHTSVDPAWDLQDTGSGGQGQQGQGQEVSAVGGGGGDEMSKRAAVLTAGSSLGLFPGSFTKPADQFGLEDLDFYDLVLVVDRDLYHEVLSRVPVEQREHYTRKVHLLTCFSEYESEGIVLATGGLALLPRALSALLRSGFKESMQVVDVPSPDLASETSQEELGAVVRTLVLACAGLCKYLMDSFPESADNNGPHKY